MNNWHPDIPEEYRNNIIMGDCRELVKRLPDESIDLIFTDPPYSGEYIPLYIDIFKMASQILKPSGFLLIYVGGYWKDDIMAEARKYLDFFWDYAVYEPHNSPVNWPRKTIARHKSVLAYTQKEQKPQPQTNVLSVWLGGGEDKRYHIWGQDESEARYFLTCFSAKGQIILDTCAGAGTIPYIAKLTSRNYIGFEIIPDSTKVAKMRIQNAIPPVEKNQSNQKELL